MFAGRLFQVMPVSVQPVPVAKTFGPFAEPPCTNRRRRALLMVDVIPVTLKRR
jgi:hypothetical protein